MSSLDAIAVKVEAATGNVEPLLHEIHHALKRVADGKEGTVIDLRSLPLAPGGARRNTLRPSLAKESCVPNSMPSDQQFFRKPHFPGFGWSRIAMRSCRWWPGSSRSRDCQSC